MFDLFLQSSGAIEWWFVSSAVLMLLLFVLFLVSAARHWRHLLWFYGASVLMACFFTLVQWVYPMVLQSLVAFRSDWSLVFLTENFSIPHVLSQLVFFFFGLGIVGLALVLVLEVWALITFRWTRMKVLFHRALSETWFVLLFAVLQVIFGMVWVSLFDGIDFATLHMMFGITSFLFVLQLFFRLVDNAGLGTPQQLTEYLFATGFAMLYVRFVWDGFVQLGDVSLVPRQYFLMQLYIFFLAVLLMGYLSVFFVRAVFSSEFYLQHYYRKTTLLSSWTSRLLLSPEERRHAVIRVMWALILAVVMGDVFLLLALQEWYLTLIPIFFLSYFFLFYLLDKQDDMKVRGDLIDQRIEKEVSRVFFG